MESRTLWMLRWSPIWVVSFKPLKWSKPLTKWLQTLLLAWWYVTYFLQIFLAHCWWGCNCSCLQALNSGIVPESLNSTFISLISKVKNPKKVSEFRPISLCNVVYKLIAKVVANRLKKLLAKMIPDSQSAFLSGRLITDNILVAFETFHFLKRKTQGKLRLYQQCPL